MQSTCGQEEWGWQSTQLSRAEVEAEAGEVGVFPEGLRHPRGHFKELAKAAVWGRQLAGCSRRSCEKVVVK